MSASPRSAPAADEPDRGSVSERVVPIVREHQDRLRSYLRGLGCPPSRVDDFVQDTFVAVLTSGFEDRGAGATAAWLRKVARNRYLDSLRRRPEPAAVESLERAWREFDAEDDGRSYLAALDACLAVLPSRTLTAIELRYREGCSRAEIASRLGLSESGAKALLVRARKELRKCILRRLGS